MDHEPVVRALRDDDFDAIVRVMSAQDIAWWGEADGDADDVRLDLDRAAAASGSLADASRVSVDDNGDVTGVALLVGHGHSILCVDPAAPDATRHSERLLDWLVESGATEIESPANDEERLALLHACGLRPVRSSFDLERSSTVDDVAPTNWPEGFETVPFRLGEDDQEVHDLIYSVWTDVEGHTHRPIDEWRSIFLHTTSFDPELVVLLRRTDDDRRLAGVAICRIFNDDMGWVSQLAVGRPDRGLGLGRQILVEAFHRLSSRQVGRLGLSVEAENSTALGLYRSVGLEVTREWMHLSLSR